MKRLIAQVMATGGDDVAGYCLIGAEIINVKGIKTRYGFNLSSWFRVPNTRMLKVFYKEHLILEVEQTRRTEHLMMLIRPRV